MNAKYRITIEHNPTFGYWGARVYYQGAPITPNWLTADTKDEAKARAEKRATDHARNEASRESYDFFPTL